MFLALPAAAIYRAIVYHCHSNVKVNHLFLSFLCTSVLIGYLSTKYLWQAYQRYLHTGCATKTVLQAGSTAMVENLVWRSPSLAIVIAEWVQVVKEIGEQVGELNARVGQVAQDLGEQVGELDARMGQVAQAVKTLGEWKDNHRDVQRANVRGTNISIFCILQRFVLKSQPSCSGACCMHKDSDPDIACSHEYSGIVCLRLPSQTQCRGFSRVFDRDSKVACRESSALHDVFLQRRPWLSWSASASCL